MGRMCQVGSNWKMLMFQAIRNFEEIMEVGLPGIKDFRGGKALIDILLGHNSSQFLRDYSQTGHYWRRENGKKRDFGHY